MVGTFIVVITTSAKMTDDINEDRYLQIEREILIAEVWKLLSQELNWPFLGKVVVIFTVGNLDDDNLVVDLLKLFASTVVEIIFFLVVVIRTEMKIKLSCFYKKVININDVSWIWLDCITCWKF